LIEPDQLARRARGIAALDKAERCFLASVYLYYAMRNHPAPGQVKQYVAALDGGSGDWLDRHGLATSYRRQHAISLWAKAHAVALAEQFRAQIDKRL
jgi:hypothetical protein